MNRLQRWLESEQVQLQKMQALSGGDIASVSLLELSDGRMLVAKTMADSTPGMFRAEARGLEAIRASGCLPAPEVVFCAEDLLLLEYIPPGPRPADFEQRLGRGLAQMHLQTVSDFGFECDTYCGATLQPNTPTDEGYRFFAEQRLLYLGKRCRERGLLSQKRMSQIETICRQLPQRIPPQLPALLHGDLWSGNLLCSAAGEPVLIDPAVYWGWPEADLAMTRLFGGFGAGFYREYARVAPLQPGWQERLDLYNLWHLLNHLLLFGGAYRAEVERVIERYV
ncbi:fructosamine kinase family protein [Neptuniibacter halophilus]|uniref:fructosamine kinase family protein n=1 Tax=Neptuniibacter halophilus TaxID=651666 RepID=UPI002573DDB2|nr:fructosamine kinase family protein [Neptuniibacter halophilus]